MIGSSAIRALIVGYGSIGSRHARLLGDLGCHVSTVTSQRLDHLPCYPTLTQALEEVDPTYVVISNRTQDHRSSLSTLLARGFTGKVLVEKPLFVNYADDDPGSRQNVYVSYNLRFHPVLQRLRKALAHERILSVHAYVGQYLPDWRPGTDYRLGYSASSQMGGGVLRDLSHELDLLNWILGPWQRLTAIGGKYSSLEIDSRDVCGLLMSFERCPVATLQLNYVDRCNQRSITVNTDQHTFVADLIEGVLRTNANPQAYTVDPDFNRDSTYLAQHRAVLSGETSVVCSFEEGLETLRIVQAAETALGQMQWVTT